MSDFTCINGHSMGTSLVCPECGLPCSYMDGRNKEENCDYYYEEEEDDYVDV